MGKNNTMRKNFFYVAFAVLILVLSLPAGAQQPAKAPRIGLLAAVSLASIPARTDGFRDGLRRLGYIEGRNIIIESRGVVAKLDRLSELAARGLELSNQFVSPLSN